MIRPIDELNTLSTPPEEYFGEMNLTKEQIAERVRYTEQTNEVILDAMMLIDTMLGFASVDYERVRKQLEDAMAGIVAGFVTVDEYVSQYISDFSENFVDATQRHEDDEWYLSEDRALYDAENSANDTINYKEYKRAVEGGKTHKKWITEKDNKVRKTHSVLDGKEIPILDTFVVGETLMRFPKDYALAYDAPRETVGCRCTIKYTK